MSFMTAIFLSTGDEFDHMERNATAATTQQVCALTSAGGSWSFFQDASDPFKLLEKHI